MCKQMKRFLFVEIIFATGVFCVLLLGIPGEAYTQQSGKTDGLNFKKAEKLMPDDLDVLENLDEMLFSDFLDVLDEDIEMIEESSIDEDLEEAEDKGPNILPDEVAYDVFPEKEEVSLEEEAEALIKD